MSQPSIAWRIGEEVDWKKEGVAGMYRCQVVAVHWTTQRYTVRVLRHHGHPHTSLAGKTRVVQATSLHDIA